VFVRTTQKRCAHVAFQTSDFKSPDPTFRSFMPMRRNDSRNGLAVSRTRRSFPNPHASVW
jgi:hypothetical protein